MMARTHRVKDLSQELRKLFEQNFSEQEAYDQVKREFDKVHLTKVFSMYSQFQSEEDKKPKHKESTNQQLSGPLHPSGPLAYFRSTLECDHAKIHCLNVWNGDFFDGRFFTNRDHTLKFDNASSYIWRDVFSNKSCRIKIPITSATREDKFWPLTHDTGFLVEYMNDDQETHSKVSLSLIEFDWTEKEMRKVHTITVENQQRRLYHHTIVTDAMDPTRFLLRSLYDDGIITWKLGQVHDNKILFKEEILPANQDTGFGLISLINNTLYTFDQWSFVRQNEAYINFTRLEQGAQTSEVMLESIPEKFSIAYENGSAVVCLAMDRLYVAVQHRQMKHREIICTDCNTRKWKSLDFCIKEPITCMQFMINGHFLWIQTTEKDTKLGPGIHEVQQAFYRIPLKKPEKLSDLAWFSLVRLKSKLEDVDRYEEAHKYLPFTSDIRFPFED